MVLVKTMFIRSPREFGAWLSTALPLVFIVVNNSESCGKFICLLRSKFIAFDQGSRVVVLFPCLRVSKQICFPIFSKTKFLILVLTVNFTLLFLYSLS